MRSRLLAPSSAWESRPGGRNGWSSNSRWQRLCCRRCLTRRPRAAKRRCQAGKKGVCIKAVYIPPLLTPLLPWVFMNVNRAQIKEEYARLRACLGRLGWISHGYVQDRGPGAGGPCYQWTRKVKAKTVSVALSREQYAALQEAIDNWHQAQEILQRMQALSRHVIFETLPSPPRRKRLGKRVLGLI